jgi:hypothetical protein
MPKYIPAAGDRVKVVGLHNDDAHSGEPDLYIDKEFTIAENPAFFYPNEFRSGCWGFQTTEGIVFYAAIIEQVPQ